MCPGGDAERRQVAECDGAVGAAVDESAPLECGGLCVGEQAGADSAGRAGEGGGVPASSQRGLRVNLT